MTEKPKTVVLILVDQLAAKWLEEADKGIVDLPNFTKLRDESANYTRAYSVNPVCSPTRATLLTGYTPSIHGLTECGYDLDPQVHTMPRFLQESGWHTAISGKLHVRTQLEGVYPDYKRYGFDKTAITEDSRAGEWLDWVRSKHPQHYEAALATVWMHFIPELKEYGSQKTNLQKEILAAYEKYPECRDEAYALPFPAEVSQTEWITSRALEFLEEAPVEKDFFLQVSYVQPHNPFSPPQEYMESVNTEAIPEPVQAEWVENRLPYFDQPLYDTPSYVNRNWVRDRHHYFADLVHLDRQIGILREKLAFLGRDENCLLIFTSDHGEMLHDHGMLGKWERHYDPCVRIPLYVCSPKLEGETIDRVTSHLNIVPTIYDFAGVEPPSHSVWSLDGEAVSQPTLPAKSLFSSPDRETVYIESNNNHWQATPNSWSRTLITQKYRFTRYFNNGGEQLFDLLNDPDEQNNLVGDKKYEDLANRLRTDLLEACVRQAYPSTNRNLYQIGSW